MHDTSQDVFNISDPLPSKDTENKSDVLFELNNNTVQAWKKGTTLIVCNSVLSGLKVLKVSQKNLIIFKTFPGAAIQDMTFTVVYAPQEKAK